MVAFTNILLLAATATAASLRRDATPLVNAINNQIVPQIDALQIDVDEFPASGLNGSIALDSGEDTLFTLVDHATTLAQEAGTFSILDVLNVQSALQPTTTKLTNYLDALAAKVTDFHTIGRETFVLANLQIGNIRWTEFTNQLIAAAPLGQAQALQASQTTISSHYNAAIKAYSRDA